MRTKKGVSNSYNSSDAINSIKWANKVVHKDVFDYIKELIAMRKAHPAFRMGSSKRVVEHLKFMKTSGTDVVAFCLDGQKVGDSWNSIIVILNAKSTVEPVEIPEGTFVVACADGLVNWQNGLGKVKGPVVSVAPRSALILHQ